MDTDTKSDGANRRLNDLVAVTVVILTVFAAVSKVKDDNINQAMQKAKSEAVDAWAEYQAARIKLHVDENGLSTLRLLETTGQIDKTLAAKQVAEYDRLNFRDDQFDMSDAFLSIAVALSAVAALVDSFVLLYIAWGSGAFGLFMGIAGFLGFSLRPEWLATLLGT